jgi:hypothetical protein
MENVMATITRITRPSQLTGKRVLELELPEFLVRALEVRVEDANAGGSDVDHVTIEHLAELTLAESLSVADVALLECRIPGIGRAVSQWRRDIE